MRRYSDTGKILSGGISFLAAFLLQIGGSISGVPGYSDVRADAVMRRAWQGRAAAVERICNEQSRIPRIRAIDERFVRLQQAYQRRFGYAWNSLGVISEGRLGMENRQGVNGVLSSDRGIDARCTTISAFAGALGEYQNGVNAAEVELTPR